MNLHTADVIIQEHRNSIGDYRAHPGANFSKLSQLAKDPRFTNIESKDTSYFAFGRYTEDLFMGEDVTSKYVIYPSNLQEPTGQMLDYAFHLINGATEEQAYENAGFKRDSLEKVKDRYVVEAKQYVDFYLAAKDKTILPPEEALRATQIATAMNTHPSIIEFKQDKRYQIYYQVPLVATFNDVIVKCLVDMLVVDTEDNVIYPIDVKTTSKRIQDFAIAAKNYRYDLQASLYTYIISNCFPGYSVSVFGFLVGSKETPNVAKLFNVTLSDLYYGRYGIITATGYKYKGWEQLVEELMEHEKLDFWDYPIELAEPVLKLKIHYEPKI